MGLNEKVKEIAEYAGCVEDMQLYERIIGELKTSRLKNIAVLGETNSGKTTLINKLAGTEVRKASDISRGEEPMMVTFHSDEKKEGFEKYDILNDKCEKAGVAFFEIPLNMAIEYESGKPTALLEQMDAVIYVLSAPAPVSGSDIKNLDALAGRFPVIIFASKADILGEEDYGQVMKFIDESLSTKYKGIVFGIYDNTQEEVTDKIVESLGQLEIDELREFHMAQIEQNVKENVAEKLGRMLDDIEVRREERKKEQSEVDSENRQHELEWNGIRLTMLEKKNEAITYVTENILKAEQETEQEALSGLRQSGYDKQWMKEDLKSLLENRVNAETISAMNEMVRVVDTHVAWLLSEVNHKFGVTLEIQDMDKKSSYVKGVVGEYSRENGYKKIALAVGSGFVAGSVILSSIPFVPTTIIALPTTFLMYTLIRDGMKDNKEYRTKAEEYVVECCKRNFSKLKKHIASNISGYYEKLVSEIVKLCNDSAEIVDFSDLDGLEAEIKSKIDEIDAL